MLNCNGYIAILIWSVWWTLPRHESIFWSYDKVNQGICLFHEQVFELSRHGGSLIINENMGAFFLYIQDLRRVSGFHLLFFPWTLMTLGVGGNLKRYKIKYPINYLPLFVYLFLSFFLAFHFFFFRTFLFIFTVFFTNYTFSWFLFLSLLLSFSFFLTFEVPLFFFRYFFLSFFLISINISYMSSLLTFRCLSNSATFTELRIHP